MDDRQTKIKEGAGLEDSRVNQDFIDFLNKWSTPVLLTLAVAALAWAGLQKLEQRKVARVEQAFSELAAATQGGNPSPASLKTIAKEYQGVGAVSEMALLTTSDLYLNAFMIGIEPGAETDPTTRLPINEADILDDDRRQVYLEQAGQIAQEVLDLSGSVEGKELIAMQAMSRLAAVAEGKRDFDGAKSIYTKLADLGTSSGYPSVAVFASTRIAGLDGLKALMPLPSADAFAPLPGEEETPALSQEQIKQMIDKAIADQEAEADAAESVDQPVESEDAPAAESDSP